MAKHSTADAVPSQASAVKKSFLDRLWCSLRNSASGATMGAIAGGTAGVLGGEALGEAFMGQIDAAGGLTAVMDTIATEAHTSIDGLTHGNMEPLNHQSCKDTLHSGVDCIKNSLNKEVLEGYVDSAQGLLTTATGAAGAAIGAGEGAAFGAGAGWQEKLKVQYAQDAAKGGAGRTA